MTIARLPGRGTLRRVVRHRERPACRRAQGDLRITRSRPERRARNMANPMAGCRVQQTCGVPRTSLLAGGPLRKKPSKPGGTARTEHPGSGRSGYTDALRRTRGQSGRSRHDWRRGIDEPQERSPTEQRLRGRLGRRTARNWRVSPKRRRPARSRKVQPVEWVKANEPIPPMQGRPF